MQAARWPVGAALAMALSACASGKTAAPAAPAATASAAVATGSAPAAVPRGRANVINEAEIAALNGSLANAFLVIQRLRPAMLRVRGGSTSSSSEGGMDRTSLVVYFDSQPLGGVDALREIMTTQVREIRYLSASDATTMFGTGHLSGAIQIISKR